MHNREVTASGEVATQERARPATVAWWAVVVVYCWIAGGFESFTWQASVAVLVPGLTIFALGISRPPDQRPVPRRIGRRGAAYWAVPLLSFCVLEIVDDLLGSTYEHPTLSILMDPVFDAHVWRSIGYLLWIVVGWALVKR